MNYGFFRAKPGHATFYDLLPDWPYYIPLTVALGIAAILILYAPWFIADAIGRNREKTGGQTMKVLIIAALCERSPLASVTSNRLQTSGSPLRVMCRFRYGQRRRLIARTRRGP